MKRKAASDRVDVTEWDEELVDWYVDEGLSIREIYTRLNDRLDDDEWATELAIKYRLEELGVKDPPDHGKFAELEAELLEADASEYPRKSGGSA